MNSAPGAARASVLQGVCLGAFAALASPGTTALAAGYPGQLVNTATVSSAWVNDPDTTDNLAQDSNAAEPVADLSITKTLHDTGEFRAGQVVRYTIDVRNAGPSAATSVQVTDIPRNLELVSITGACTALPCTLEQLAADATARIEVGARILAPGDFDNAATVSADDARDPDGSNNQADGGGGHAQSRALAPVDDTAETAQNTPVTIAILDNDGLEQASLHGSGLSVHLDTLPGNGKASIDEDGRLHYVPHAHFSGTETLVYRLCSTTDGACASATVSVTVAANRLTLLDDVIQTHGDAVRVDVLANDTSTGAPLDPASLTVIAAPDNGTVQCTPAGCRYEPDPAFIGQDRFTYQVCDVSLPVAVCGTAEVRVEAAGVPVQLRLSKKAAVRTVRHGDLVRYTIAITNLGDVPARDIRLLDTLPAGFSLVDGSLQVQDGDDMATVGSVLPLRVDGIDLDPGASGSVSYHLRVGAGVRPGNHRNLVIAQDPAGRPVSNQASADVTFEGDPLFQDSLVLGSVFEDHDGNGRQAAAAAHGIRLRIQDGGAAVASGTTVIVRDGQHYPVPDAALQDPEGLLLGDLPGRSSSAAAPASVEVRQVLRPGQLPGRIDVHTDEGSQLRMDDSGAVVATPSGAVAARNNRQHLMLRRELGQVADGVEIRHVVSNLGIDERGVPGVRLASVEGLLVQTDASGRFHLTGVDGGGLRGRNVLLKLDPGTLPPGTAFTTPNPLLQRVTEGLPVRFDFGVQLPAVDQQAPAPSAEIIPDWEEQGDDASPRLEAEGVMQALPREGRLALVVEMEENGEAVAIARAGRLDAWLDTALPADLRGRVDVVVRRRSTAERLLLLGRTARLEGTWAHSHEAVGASGPSPWISLVAGRVEASPDRVVEIDAAHMTDMQAIHRADALFKDLSTLLPAAVRAQLRVAIVRSAGLPSNNATGQ